MIDDTVAFLLTLPSETFYLCQIRRERALLLILSGTRRHGAFRFPSEKERFRL